MRKTLVAAVAAIMLVSGSPAFAQSKFETTVDAHFTPDTTFYGTVSSSNAKCLGRTIKVLDPSGKTVGKGHSDPATGSFTVGGTLDQAGNYTVKATAKDFMHGHKTCLAGSDTILIV